MKKNFLNVMIMAAAVSAFAGCQDELDQNKVKEGDYIPFAISEEKTRTAYSDTDEFQINWVDGDKVRVFCYEAEDVNNAEYGVTKDATEENTGKLNPNSNGLKWGGYENEHKFYAVYPSDADKISVDQSGIATVKFNLNQTVTVGTETSDFIPTTPDMSNACMVAYATGVASTTSEANPIKLKFKPIMTTLKIIVKGKGINKDPVTLTGITLSMEVPSAVAKTGSFQYNIAGKSIVVNNEGTTSTETIFVNFKTSDGTDAVELKDADSVAITAFLPPVPVSADNKVKVRLQATGATNVSVTLGKSGAVCGASEKAIIRFGNIPDNQTGNNWITPLDDNIYVQQLSIPGTHDAAARNTMSYIGVTGNAQAKTITQQLDMGIRAFDFRAAYRTGSGYNSMWMWHGFLYCDVSLNDCLDDVKNYLKANPGEFSIIQFRHETETRPLSILTPKNTSNWASGILASLQRIDVADGDYKGIIQWKEDLTIGECRGHIIVLTRDDYAGRTKAALVENFPYKTTGDATINGETTYKVQDYYAYTGDEGNEKKNQIKALYNISKTLCESGSKRIWVLNHTSGYCGTNVFDFDIELGSDIQYMRNASYVNKDMYDVLSSETNCGPTGIVFMDYVGERTYDGFTVYGDLLPQAIIDNNYKYRMLRKGE